MEKTPLKSILTHPNPLTLFRIVAVPVIVILLMVPNRLTAFVAGLIFSAAAITDYFDGYFARKSGRISNFGKIMDPVADKLLVSSAFIMMAALGRVPAWIVPGTKAFTTGRIITSSRYSTRRRSSRSARARSARWWSRRFAKRPLR